MIMDQILSDRMPEMVLPKEDHLVQTLRANRFHDAFGVGVQIGTSRGEHDGLDAGGLENGVEPLGKERISVMKERCAMAQKAPN